MTRILVAIALAFGVSSPAQADEVMKDKCRAGEVAITDYDDRPDSGDAVILKLTSKGKTEWTPPFTVKLSDAGHIRWWCHSTTGNAFDPGTWRVKDIHAGIKCDIYADGSPESCSPAGKLPEIGSSEWKGWTPERSRCNNRSRHIKARLDGRTLKIKCLDP